MTQHTVRPCTFSGFSGAILTAAEERGRIIFTTKKKKKKNRSLACSDGVVRVRHHNPLGVVLAPQQELLDLLERVLALLPL